VNVLTGTIADLRARTEDDVLYRLLVAGDGSTLQQAIAAIPGVVRVKCERVSGGLYDVEAAMIAHSTALPLLIRLLVERELDIRSCAKQEASLEQIFRDVVRRTRPVHLEVAAR
jgi:hypothetical protein